MKELGCAWASTIVLLMKLLPSRQGGNLKKVDIRAYVPHSIRMRTQILQEHSQPPCKSPLLPLGLLARAHSAKMQVQPGNVGKEVRGHRHSPKA